MRATPLMIALLASGCLAAPSRPAGTIDATQLPRVVRAVELASQPEMPADEAIARVWNGSFNRGERIVQPTGSMASLRGWFRAS